MRGWFAIMSFLGLSSVGCVAQSHPPTSPIALESFCARFFDALCEPLDACECGVVASEQCRAEQRAICGGFPSAALEGAIADGSLTYDAEAASEILRRLDGRGCDGFVRALDWRVRDLFSLGGVFEGTRSAGEPCTNLGFELISACRLGSCTPSADGNICRASARDGELCDRTHQCVDLDRELRLAASADFLVLRCEPESPGSEVGTCRHWLGEGDACASDTGCWTGRCVDDVCVAAELGGECLSTRECAAGSYCTSLACAAGGAPDGASCDDAAACASTVCVGGRCLASGCDTF